MPGERGGEVLNKFLFVDAPPGGPTPYPLKYDFFTKKVPFSFTFYWQMVPISYTLFRTLSVSLLTAVNALSFK